MEHQYWWMFRPNGLLGSVHDDDWRLVVIKTSINSKDDASVAPLWFEVWRWDYNQNLIFFKNPPLKRRNVYMCEIHTFGEGGTVSQTHISFNQWSSSRPDGGQCERIESQRRLSLGRWTGTLLCSVGWSGYEDTLEERQITEDLVFCTLQNE